MSPDLQKLQWHPRVHETVGGETLHYWFLSFTSNFEWERLRGELRQVLDEHGVLSYALYELMGDYDIVLRVWLPTGTGSKFEVSLQERLAMFSLARADRYNVVKVIRHWPFNAEGAGDIDSLDEEDGLPLNGVVQEVNDRLLEEAPAEGDSTLEGLLATHLLGPPLQNNDGGSGVKIVTLIKPVHALPPQQKQALGRRIAEVLDQQPLIKQRSLYQLEGWNPAFLLTCQAPQENFFTFREKLIHDLSPMLEPVGARTNSYSCASRDLVMFQDLITPPEQRNESRISEPAVNELLQLEESVTLEVKGSAFAPLDPWLFNGEELAESTRFFHRGVLRAIVAFLNTEGGSVVIGGLEAPRYRDRLPSDRLAEFQLIGAYLCCGIRDPSYTERHWDVYERKLSETITSSVTPDPLDLLNIRKERFEGFDFCVIDVRGAQGKGWHYLDPQRDGTGPQFLVRIGARTVELGGHEADRYKEERKAG
ncbi:MAG TPA: hypothetical protein VF030_05325 [Solirubrobacterales bacterium]